MTLPRPYHFDLAGCDFVRANSAIWRAALPRWRLFLPLYYLIALALIVLGQLGLVKAGVHLSSAAIYAPFGALAGMGVASIVWGNGQMQKASGKGAPLQGPITLTLDETGVHQVAPGGSMTVYWSHVTDVLVTRDGLLLRAGPINYFVLPKSVFASPAEETAALEAIRARIAAAKGAL